MVSSYYLFFAALSAVGNWLPFSVKKMYKMFVVYKLSEMYANSSFNKN